MKKSAAIASLLTAALLASAAGSATAQPKASPMTAQQVAEMFASSDTNGNGLLEREEWLLTLSAERRPHAEPTWRRLSPDGTGISRERLVAIYTTPVTTRPGTQ